jgi:hypothetical protein
MHLVQILLPVFDNQGQEFPAELFETIARELTARFGGLTSYVRSPAEGRWNHAERTDYDEIIVLEVMTHAFDRDWWRALRVRLEDELRQKEVVIRVTQIERI